jgi:hypothetical protein
MAAQSKAGRAGKVTLAGTTIPITKWSFKWDKGLTDTTDSSNYDATTGQTYQAQLPTIIRGDGALDFHWDAATTPTSLIAKFKADPTVAVVLMYDNSTNAFGFNADLSEVEITLEVAGLVDGSANFKTNGVITSY